MIAAAIVLVSKFKPLFVAMRIPFSHIFTLIAFLFLAIGANAQLEVGLRSGNVLRPLSLYLDEVSYDDVYLIVDGKKVSPEDVDYYQTESGYYKWYLDTRYNAGFRVIRVDHDTISTFARVDQRYYKSGKVADEVTDKHAGYFQKNSQNMLEISYMYLYQAVEDNPKALAYLKKTELNNKLAKVGHVVGATLIMGGIIHTIASSSGDGNGSSFSPLFYPGFAFTGASVALRIPYKKRLRKTIEIYNQ